MKNLNSILGKIFLLVILICIGYFCMKDIYIKSIVGKSNLYIITKFIRKNDLPKTTTFYFDYYFNNAKVTVTNSGINDSHLDIKIIDNMKINCFYLAKFEPKYPNVIIVNPEKQVTDTTEILKAGFSIEDIKN
jgi:hypothetical protein